MRTQPGPSARHFRACCRASWRARQSGHFFHHRVGFVFKLSNDPAFVGKLHAIVGLHVSPLAHAVVLSVDEKNQIQALDRTQPGLPIKKRRGATMAHDYKRHGTTRLFAGLNVLEGAVFWKNMQRHRGARISSASSDRRSAARRAWSF